MVNIIDTLTKMRQELDECSSETNELRTLIAQLIDILRNRGDLNDGHQRSLQKLAKRARRPTRPVVKLSTIGDKYAVPSPDIDCASLLHLCKGRCCSLTVPLSEQDIHEGSLSWDIREPYILERWSDGYCMYFNREAGGCQCYQKRPGRCRSYDCRQDRRVWIDFENRIPAPLPTWLIPIGIEKSTKTDPR